MTASADRMLDLRGLRCPLPALKTRRALREAPAGATIAVRSDDPLAGVDIPNVARECGAATIDAGQSEGVWTFTIRASADRA